jgi:allantoinase
MCFDQLYEESQKTGRIMNFGMHPHVMGQPFRIRALREFIEDAAAHKDVWFVSREAIASWYLQNHQSHIPTAL